MVNRIETFGSSTFVGCCCGQECLLSVSKARHPPPSPVRAPEVSVRFAMVLYLHACMIPGQFLTGNADGDCAQEDGFRHRTGLDKVRLVFFAAEAGIHEMMIMITRRQV